MHACTTGVRKAEKTSCGKVLCCSLPHVSCLKHPLKLLDMSRTICHHHHCSNSDATIIQNHLLHSFNVFISCCRVVLGRKRCASSLTYSRPSLNQLYHNWTCVLLLMDSPNATVNISNAFAHLI